MSVMFLSKSLNPVFLYCQNMLRSAMVLITGMVVILIPNIATLMALVGATCCTLLAFILPGLFHMEIFKE